MRGPFEAGLRLIDARNRWRGGATRVIVESKGAFEVCAWPSRQLRTQTWRGGRVVRVKGTCRATPRRAERVAWQQSSASPIDWAGGRHGRGRLSRVESCPAAVERGAAALPPDDAALFRGLVIGDDRDQPRAMLERFRASGLAHLTAVSGQNVSFVIAAAGPLLSRLRPSARWLMTIGLIAWFVSLTRFEPSIVRAGTMAAISTTAFVRGRDRSPFRVLCLPSHVSSSSTAMLDR